MWRRNGVAVANEAINYGGTGNRVLMADLDLSILQLGAALCQPGSSALQLPLGVHGPVTFVPAKTYWSMPQTNAGSLHWR